jgi:hypothetical protein
VVPASKSFFLFSSTTGAFSITVNSSAIGSFVLLVFRLLALCAGKQL